MPGRALRLDRALLDDFALPGLARKINNAREGITTNTARFASEAPAREGSLATRKINNAREGITTVSGSA
jgi:hypothetical protein